jgi:hypothetical protein
VAKHLRVLRHVGFFVSTLAREKQRLGSEPMKWIGTRNLGMLLLAIWLIATGAMALTHITFAYAGSILAVLAVAAGILILLGR